MMQGSLREDVEELLINILDERNNYYLSEYLSPLYGLIVDYGAEAANIILENKSACDRILSLLSSSSTHYTEENLAFFITIHIANVVDLDVEAQEIIKAKIPYFLNLLHRSCTLPLLLDDRELALKMRNNLNFGLCVLAAHQHYREHVETYIHALSLEKLLDLLVLDNAQPTRILRMVFETILFEQSFQDNEKIFKIDDKVYINFRKFKC